MQWCNTLHGTCLWYTIQILLHTTTCDRSLRLRTNYDESCCRLVFFFMWQLWVGRSGQDDDNDRFVAHLFQCRRQSSAAIGALFCPCADCNRRGYYIYARACACTQSAPRAQSGCPDYIIIYERRQASAHACILCFRLCAVAVAKLSTLALQPPLASICIICLHLVSCIS